MYTIDEIVNNGWGTRAEAIAYTIEQCKAQLTATDYKAIKYAEGELSAEEYEPIRIDRRNLRARINELEKEL